MSEEAQTEVAVVVDDAPATLDASRYPAAIERFAVTMVAAFEGLPFSQSSTSVRLLRSALAELRAARTDIERRVAAFSVARADAAAADVDPPETGSENASAAKGGKPVKGAEKPPAAGDQGELV